MELSRTRRILFSLILILLLAVAGISFSLFFKTAPLSSWTTQFVKLWLVVVPSDGPPPDIKPILGTLDERGFERAWVSKVIDGDTIELSDGRKVRYVGIDTPETKHPTKKVECFGKEASQRNTELATQQLVFLQKDISDTDRYGRLLRYVWLGDVLLNYQLVAEGFAHSYSYPPDITKQPEFQLAEHRAKEANVGLWGSCPLE